MLEQLKRGERVQPYDMENTDWPNRTARPVQAFRSLAVLRPDLAAQLHPIRNGDLDPARLGQHSRLAVWWLCPECGHEWRMPVKARTQPNGHAQGCPACGRRRSIEATVARNRREIEPQRSLATRYPELLAEWHPTLNPDLDPYRIAAGSSRKAWWRCAECGHEWQAAVGDRARTRAGRSRPSGCPSCWRERRRARGA